VGCLGNGGLRAVEGSLEAAEIYGDDDMSDNAQLLGFIFVYPSGAPFMIFMV
jgi:hypothetical protein